MTDPDREKFGVTITALARTFNREADEPLLLSYWMGLEDLDMPTVNRGASRAMRESKFMPTVAELRELAGEILPADRASLAWQAFREALQLHGCYTSVDFDDKLINATVRNLGGWVDVDLELDEHGETWVRKNFETVYQTFLRTGATAKQVMALGGIHAIANSGHGYETGAPLIIADGLPPHRAGLVELPAPAVVPLIECNLKGVEEVQ